MVKKASRILFLIPVLAALLTGCAPKHIPPSTNPTANALHVPGLTPLEDSSNLDLLRAAIGLPSQGNLLTGKVFQADRPVAVYRVWNKNKAWSKMGRWWTLEKPQGPIEVWRAKYNVCEEWGPRNVLSKCQLKTGVKIVLGPGQSIDCHKEKYPPSPAEQVYVPNGLATTEELLEKCEPDVNWP